MKELVAVKRIAVGDKVNTKSLEGETSMVGIGTVEVDGELIHIVALSNGGVFAGLNTDDMFGLYHVDCGYEELSYSPGVFIAHFHAHDVEVLKIYGDSDELAVEFVFNHKTKNMYSCDYGVC